jgi:unsaturated chondroitin disaccharide hydrolase
MKKSFLIALFIPFLIFSSCRKQKTMQEIIDESFSFALKQYNLMAEVMKEKPDLFPRTIDSTGALVTVTSDWWTSGFFPGSLWFLYEYSGDEKFKDDAILMTERLEKEKYNKGTHDLGFMMYNSYGNGLRLTVDTAYEKVLLTAAKSLSTRFRPNVGCIQSWGSSRNWQCPVIIDNMMNLELLMWAFEVTGDSLYYKICISHSDTTIKNHYRPDYSSYHVVSYDTITGKVQVKQTHQGADDESAWSRGQIWGLYGFISMYRETHLERYLDQATHIADFLINHPNMPEDKIPYWDFNAPDIPNAKRDASAGAIMASALIDLSRQVDSVSGKKYLEVAEKQIRTLASPEYMAKLGENGNFILKHSVGSLPDKSEVDVPLPYADYYFLEALLRYSYLKHYKSIIAFITPSE